MYLVSELVDRDFLARPDVFSDDALRVSCQLLRGYRPRLALRLQNLLHEIPLCDSAAEDPDHAGRYYRVDLSVSDLLETCEALEAAAEAHFSRQPKPQLAVAEEWIVVWAVIADWRRLLDATRQRKLTECAPLAVSC